MLNTGAAMSALTEYPDLVYKVRFFQNLNLVQRKAKIDCQQVITHTYEKDFMGILCDQWYVPGL